MSLLSLLGKIILFLAGATLVIGTLGSVIRTFVLPRSASDAITRAVFLTMRMLFNLRMRKVNTYEARDKIMALYAPVSLLMLVPVWLIMVDMGYTAIFMSIGLPFDRAFLLSGSSIMTLGYSAPQGLLESIISYSEAAVGLILIALLIAYLPTMYTAFSQREAAVNMLEVRAGAPPSAVTMISRLYRIGRFDHLNELWEEWERWFVYVEETHTSLAALAFFRSPQAGRSWITAAGAVLDAASMINAVVDVKHDPRADLCIRAGYLCLREIANFFQMSLPPIPNPNDPESPCNISITRDEFNQACHELESAGVPLKSDRDKAWRDFAGWRITYDVVLLNLAALVMAPYAPWTSDRQVPKHVFEPIDALTEARYRVAKLNEEPAP